MQPGLEIYGADADEHKVTSNRWLFACNGSLLKYGSALDFGFGVPSAWWDADLQRELVRGSARDYEGGGPSVKRLRAALSWWPMWWGIGVRK